MEFLKDACTVGLVCSRFECDLDYAQINYILKNLKKCALTCDHIHPSETVRQDILNYMGYKIFFYCFQRHCMSYDVFLITSKLCGLLKVKSRPHFVQQWITKCEGKHGTCPMNVSVTLWNNAVRNEFFRCPCNILYFIIWVPRYVQCQFVSTHSLYSHQRASWSPYPSSGSRSHTCHSQWLALPHTGSSGQPCWMDSRAVQSTLCRKIFCGTLNWQICTQNVGHLFLTWLSTRPSMGQS